MKKPKSFTLVNAIGSNDKSKMYQICWEPYRKEFIEPITNKEAESVLGKIIYWEYMKCLIR
jgi:hypothetical protein